MIPRYHQINEHIIATCHTSLLIGTNANNKKQPNIVPANNIEISNLQKLPFQIQLDSAFSPEAINKIKFCVFIETFFLILPNAHITMR